MLLHWLHVGDGQRGACIASALADGGVHCRLRKYAAVAMSAAMRQFMGELRREDVMLAMGAACLGQGSPAGDAAPSCQTIQPCCEHAELWTQACVSAQDQRSLPAIDCSGLLARCELLMRRVVGRTICVTMAASARCYS